MKQDARLRAATREEWRERVRAELEDEDPDVELARRTPAGAVALAVYGPEKGPVGDRYEGVRPDAGWVATETVDLGDDDAATRASDARRLGIESLRLVDTSGRADVAGFVEALDGAGARFVATCPRILEAALRSHATCVGAIDPFRASTLAPVSAPIDLAVDARAIELVPAGVLALEVDASGLRERGGDAVLELAWFLASVVERFRANAGIALRYAVRLATGRDVFEEVAKLRAARALAGTLGHMLEQERWSVEIRAVGLRLALAEVDTATNAVRASSQAVTAALGGADAIEVLPFEGATGRALRLSRTTHAVLRDEAWLDAVADPTGGAWYVEDLTDQLARAAWERFRDIERAGGLARFVATGALESCLAEGRSARDAALADGSLVVVGVNRYTETTGRAGR
ncbi:MAG: methylmalonyl-CoA mutase family protein [Planctomycetota bacterium]